ncbi:MAG TPA: hypothetical protein VNW71_18780, partial [Thermoanaerobaculia bacterium]|nr:hypothetical protein [Thermoanaerobaculia bacterium]
AELRIEGIRTTKPLFQALLADPDFRSGNMDIAMLDRKLESGELQPPQQLEDDLPLIAAALDHHERANRTASSGSAPGLRSRWGTAGRRGIQRDGSWT